MDLKKYIRSIPDYPKKGILFRDITTLIKNPEAFNFSVDKIIEISKKIKFDKVAAIESRGFIFAAVVSYRLKKPLIMMRKKNKLPAERYSVDFELEYGEEPHHIAECICKCLARALDSATSIDERLEGRLPSTKGSL